MTLGQKASLLWAVGAGRYVQTCGLFMLGMLIGRRKLFISSEENSRFWIKTLIITAIAFGPLYQLKVLLMDTADSAIVRQTAGVVLDMWQKFAFTFVLVSSFVLLYQWEGFRAFHFRLALVWEDEFDELRVAILFRCVDLFPDRLEFGSLLRLYGQYVHRYRLFLLASTLL